MSEMARKFMEAHQACCEDMCQVLDEQSCSCFADLVEALKAEREACAKVAESYMDGSSHATLVAGTIAAAIRARTP
jgi:hypothetical protein